MTRTSEFQKGLADRQRRKAQSRSDDDTPTPQETAAMLAGFGVSQFPPGESFRAHLNQSTPHPLPGSARTMTTRGPVAPIDSNTLATMRDSRPATASPNWAAVNAQRQNLQEAIAGGAISSGLGFAPGQYDANTLATMGAQSAIKTRRDAERDRFVMEQANLPQSEQQGSGGTDANIEYIRNYQPPPTSPPQSEQAGRGVNARPESTTTEMQYDSYGNVVPDSGGTVVGPNADAAVAVNPSTGLPEDNRQDDSGSLWGRIGNFANAAVHSVPGVNAVENLVGEIREEAGERALEGMNASRAQSSGASHTLNPVTNAMPPVVTGAARAMEGAVPTPEQAGRYVYEAGFQDTVDTARSVITDPRGAAENVWSAADTLVTNPTQVWRAGKRIVPAVVRYYRQNPGELAKLGVGAAIGVATGSFANAAIGAGTTAVRGAATTSRIVRGATTALDAADDAARVTRPVRTAASAAETGEDIIRAATKPTVRQAAVEAVDRGITRLDTGLNRAITAKENVRNTVMNAPRRAVGLPEKDLRVGAVSRVRERAATRIAGEGDSDARQLVASRVAPTRAMPELPDTTGRRVKGNIENYWRRNAIDAVTPDVGNPVPEINAAIGFAENPLGWAMDRLKLDDAHDAEAAVDDVAQGGRSAAFRARSSKPKSTAKRRMPELSQPEPGDEIPEVNRPETDEPIYQAAESPMSAAQPSPYVHRTTTYNSPDKWKEGEPQWAPATTPPATAPAAGGGAPPGGGGTPAAGTPAPTGGGSGNNQTPQYRMGRGFQPQQSSTAKAKGFWEGRPEFTGTTSNYDRLTIRPITVARGGDSPFRALGDVTGAAVAGAAVRKYRNFRGRNPEQGGGPVESEETSWGKDAFGDEKNYITSYEEGMQTSPEAQAKIDAEAAWKPPEDLD